MTSLFCFGFGYSARRLSRDLLAEGWSVAGTTRTGEAAAAVPGADVFAFDRARPLGPDGRARLAAATHVVVSVPPDDGGDPVLDALRPALRAAPRLGWLAYLSTTGVYGDTGGAWVDESSPVQPDLPRSRRRVAAERRWLALAADGVPVQVFRLAGIYGPGRSAIDVLRAGTARRIDKPGHLFSRIHVADIARVLRASIARPRPGAIYNVCDDEPAEQQAVVAHAAELLEMAAPPLVPFAAAELSPMARSFYADNRRVRNDLIKNELGVRLRYPTYREGLAAIVAAGPDD